MTPYKCPNANCTGGVEDLVFHEPMVNRQDIHPKTGEIRSEYEPSDEETPFFQCGRCGTIVADDGESENFQSLFDEWLAYSEKLKAEWKKQKQREKEARQEKARHRKRAKQDDLREQYRQESGFLPPVPRKSSR